MNKMREYERGRVEGAAYQMDALASWDDYRREIKEQLNINTDIRWNR